MLLGVYSKALYSFRLLKVFHTRTQYIDVRVKEIKFADVNYISERLCENTNSNGKSDLATMVLSQSIDFRHGSAISFFFCRFKEL